MKEYPNSNGIKLYIDSWYDKDEENEKDAFLTAMASLRESLRASSGLSTDHVRQGETDNDLLKRVCKEQQNAREDAEEKLKGSIEEQLSSVLRQEKDVKAYKIKLVNQKEGTHEAREKLKSM